MTKDSSTEPNRSDLAQLDPSSSANAWSHLGAAIAFYTTLPVPQHWTLNFHGVARLAPFIGVFIGLLLSLIDGLFHLMEIPSWTRSVLIVLSWIALTGGLHLDGAMDTADGLAVQDPQRRLQVMTDSRTGAFGTIAAVAIILLKTVALFELTTNRWIVLILAAGWGRWGQLVAIARYPYLKPSGKGAFHKQAIQSTTDLFPGLIFLAAISGLEIILDHQRWPFAISMTLGGFSIAVLTGAWFHRQLGGHTGDTYGAVVEWTEAIFLCLLTIL